MPPAAFDALVLLLLAGMTYALMSEGLWGAVLQFFNTLFAAIITFNFYEPLASLIASNISAVAGFADSVSMMLLYCISLIMLRLTTDSLAPAMVRFPMPLYHLGRIVFAVGGSAITLGMILLALQASPGQKRIFGAYEYDHKPFYGTRFDTEFLGLFQHVTGTSMSQFTPGANDPFDAFENTRVFDPRGRWMIDHQNSRPYGDQTVPRSDAASGGGAAAGGGAAPNAGDVRAGAAAGQGGGPGIPGGTAGAASGLAPTNN